MYLTTAVKGSQWTTVHHGGATPQPTLLVTHSKESSKHGTPWTRAPAPVSPNDQSWVCPTVSWPAIDRRPHTARVVQPSWLIHFLPFAPKSKLGPVRLPLGTCAPLQVPASHAWRAVSQREEILFSCLRSSGPRLLPPCCVCCWQVCTQVETGFHLSATFVIGLIGYEPLD